MFKRKKKEDGNGASGNDTDFSNLETGSEETADLLERLQSGMTSVQQHRHREAQQMAQDAERARMRAEEQQRLREQKERERAPRRGGCCFRG